MICALSNVSLPMMAVSGFSASALMTAFRPYLFILRTPRPLSSSAVRRPENAEIRYGMTVWLKKT